MELRIRAPGEQFAQGIWNIPLPEAGISVVPDIVTAPVVGCDRNRYRLGYGGVYIDRTLAARSLKPFLIGAGYAQGEVEKIYPLRRDILMDVIVTDRSCTD